MNDDIIEFLERILEFANEVIIPLILALAFLFFIWNAFRYFIYEGDTQDGKESAKRLALWGILAFVFILSLWGIVNVLVYGLDFDRENPITPDYMEERGGGQYNNPQYSNFFGTLFDDLFGDNDPEQTQSQCVGGQVCIDDPTAPGTTVCFAC